MTTYVKILLSIFPLLIFSFFGAVGTTYYFSRKALRDQAVNWLEIRLDEAFNAAALQEEMLRRFELESIAPSVKKAQMDAGRIIADVRVGENGHAFAVNRFGAVQEHPDAFHLLTHLTDPQWHQQILDAEAGRFTFTDEENRFFAVFKYFLPWDWYIVAAIPERDLLGVLNRTRPWVLLITLAGGSGIGIILMLITRRLIDPLRRIAQSAENIGKGNLGVRIPIKRSDELGKLVDAFNQMADRLAKSHSDLMRSELHFRLLIENASDIIVLVRRDGAIEYASPSVARIMDYTPAELIGSSIFDKVHSDDLDAVTRAFKTMTEQIGTAAPFECRFQRKDGTWRSIEAVANNLLEDPTVGGVIVNARDITEKKQMEALRQSKIAAEASSNAKSEFLANMSHEIRTPMNAIVGLIHLMQQVDVTEKQRSHLNVMERSIQNLMRILNDILDFSKIEKGELELEETEFSPRVLADHVMELFSKKVSEKSLELMVHAAPDVPELLRGDPLRLGQVLNIIVDNAAKFTETGDIVVRMAIKDRWDETVRLHFSVKDTGIGIPENIIPHLFSPFTQADASITRRFGGTGLGLAISSRLVALMGGDLGVESRLGVGSEFRFSVPLRMVRQSIPMPAVQAEPWEGLCALVLHGNEAFQDMMRDLLSYFHIHVLSAGTLREAMSVLRKSEVQKPPVALAFINATLSDATGGQAANKIKSTAPFTGVLTTLMHPSGLYEPISPEDVDAVDCQLEKPIRFGALASLLRSLFLMPEPVLISERERVPEADALKGIRVLLVEDNAINQEVQREILSTAGIEVDLAENGNQAAEAVRKTEYDLVLMDVQMPFMDGIEATRIIRKDPANRDLPIIAMTAHTFPWEKDLCAKAGMNAFIAKPVDPAALFEVISRWTRRPLPADATVAKADASGSIPDSLPVIDKAEAVARVRGKTDLIDRMIHIFIESYRDAAQIVKTMLQDGKEKRAAEFLHSIKGAAGSISANRLHKAAADLEQAILQNKPEQGFSLEHFNRELEVLIDFVETKNSGKAPEITSARM